MTCVGLSFDAFLVVNPDSVLATGDGQGDGERVWLPQGPFPDAVALSPLDHGVPHLLYLQASEKCLRPLSPEEEPMLPNAPFGHLLPAEVTLVDAAIVLGEDVLHGCHLAK